MAVERTFVMIKPDGVCRRLIGELTGRLEKAGLKIIGLRLEKMPRTKAEALYAVHKGKPFYDELVAYATSDPVVLMVAEGENAVAKVREVIGKTDPAEAAPGTVRADFGLTKGKNTIHASDSVENAAMEAAIFFSDSQLFGYATDKYRK
jgi:nucleoside-diphosphate kinase